MFVYYKASNSRSRVIRNDFKSFGLRMKTGPADQFYKSDHPANSINMITKTISHYKLTEKIGEGGMGCIYRALDLNLNREVALKVLPPHLCKMPEMRKRFLQEARLLSSIENPHICTIHDIFEDEQGSLYMVMTCYNGKTLRFYLKQGSINCKRCISIIQQICSGLSSVHKEGIVHQDIKPENVIIILGNIVKIIDFGTAQFWSRNRYSQSAPSIGTLVYMSPEQFRHITVDHRTDIWSLGIIFYEMLAGYLPFDNEFEQAIVYAILYETPIRLKHIPDQLNRIIFRCLEKDRDNRYQSMDEVLTALQIFQAKNKKHLCR